MKTSETRRQFIKSALSGLTTTACLSGIGARKARASTREMPYRPLGKTGAEVSLVTLGGAHIGYEHVEESEAVRIIHAAIDEGINFFDNSWDYNNGESETRMGNALAQDGKRKKVFLMTKFCCHRKGWTRKAALEMLDDSLMRLRTEYLDLWQLHELSAPDHPFNAYLPDSAIEAMIEARRAGKVRFVGFTGHTNPWIHLDMLKRGFQFDTVQLPLNVLDAHYLSFEQQVLPELLERGIGVIGMKPLGGGNRTGAIPDTGVASAVECLHYAMSLPVSTVCTGIISQETLKQAVVAARTFTPLSRAQRFELLERTRQLAEGGRHESYKRELSPA